MKKPLTEASKHLVLYQGMSNAITQCDSVDECKDIADRSVAAAAYFAQIKDTETERKFYRVRLRAWRRIGELFSVVDLSGCDTQAAKVKEIKKSFDTAVVDAISDSRMLEILRLMVLPEKDFEYALKRVTAGSISHLLNWRTPEAEAQLAENKHKMEEAQRADEKARHSPEAVKAFNDQIERNYRQRMHTEELQDAASKAMAEVGITLERKDRENMKAVVFLIKEEVHALMRQAAFDHKITMQEILRRGLKMWLVAQGYDFPGPDIPPLAKRHKDFVGA